MQHLSGTTLVLNLRVVRMGHQVVGLSCSDLLVYASCTCPFGEANIRWWLSGLMYSGWGMCVYYAF